MRVYIVVVAAWLMIWGVIALNAHLEAAEAEAAIRRSDFDPNIDNDATITINSRQNLKRVFYEAAKRTRREAEERREMALITMPTLPLGLLIAWGMFLWIAAAFRLKA